MQPSKMQSESHAAHFYTPFVKPTRRYSATQTTTPMRRPSFPINVTRTDIKGVYDRNNSIDHYTQTIQKQPAPPSRSQKPRLGKSQPEKSAASAHPDKWNCSTVDRKPYQFPITKYQARLPAVAYQLPASEQRPQVAHQAPPKMQRLSAVANQAPPTENELRRPRGANQPPQTEQTLQAVTYQPPPTGETLRAVAYQPPPSEQLRPQPSRTARTHISDCGFDGADLSALPLTRRGSPEPMEARIWRLNTLDKIKKEQDKASRETAPEITPEPGKGKDPKRNSGYGYRKMAGQMDGGDDDEGRPPRSSRVVPTVVAVTKVVEKTAKSGRDGYMRGFFGPPSEAKAASKKADSRKNLQTRRSQKNKEQLKLTSNLEIPDSHASASEWSDISNSRPSKSVPAQAPKTPKKPAKLDKQEIRDSFGPSDSDIITISDGDSPPFRVGIPAPYQTKRTGVSSDKSLKNTNEILEDDGQARKASKASNSAFTRRASSRINQRRVLLTAQDPEDKETTLFKPISRPNQKQNRVRFGKSKTQHQSDLLLTLYLTVPEPTMREREDRRRKRRGESTTEAEQQNTTAATSMQSTPAPSVSGTGLLTSALTLREVKAAKAAQRKATKEMAANDAHEKDQAEKLAAFYETCQDPSHENYGLLTYDPSIDYGALDRLDPKSKNFIPALDEDDGKQGKYSPRTKAKILACHDVSEAELDLPAAAYVKRFANDEERKARLHYEKQKGKKPLDWSALNKAPFEFDKQKYEMEQRKVRLSQPSHKHHSKFRRHILTTNRLRLSKRPTCAA